ncbi:Mitochondrial distribution and morphology protein 12 [Linderina pennispora]|nr:Mitochondrial distribution and morphology protein 12 [Linderina pennispora]
MSFTIHWEKLDKKVAQSIQQQLNSFFARLEKRPVFLGDITVEGLDFGSTPPDIEILDLTEPYPEFYMATEEEEEEEDAEREADVAMQRIQVMPASQTSSRMFQSQGLRGASTSVAAADSDYQDIDDDLESVLSGLPDRPISQASIQQFLQPPMGLLRTGSMTPGTRIWQSPSLYSAQTMPRTPLQQQQQQRMSLGTSTFSSAMPHRISVERTDDDMQLLTKLEYKGDMSLVLSTELQLNYPASQFASLPVTMHITKIEFSALAVVAYLKGRINFCFLEPEPPRTSLLDNFCIRTEIGDQHHHVLKNVEKLELFITEQLRKAIDDDFVFPCYHSFELE